LLYCLCDFTLDRYLQVWARAGLVASGKQCSRYICHVYYLALMLAYLTVLNMLYSIFREDSLVLRGIFFFFQQAFMDFDDVCGLYHLTITFI